ncbi:hypothetical protein DH2020_027682 [Rehmannia glutinosa]|uniref:GDSL esterase/lipase n=1 Tax=Rehmannia glutinosa TaxID=99300 RepID=A0ABR0VTJ0_REHGL
MKVSFKLICILILLVQTCSTCGRRIKCPFQYLYHFGDGVTDIGNSIRVFPWGPSNPAARYPYGTTYPGVPTGRWSDGLIDFDYSWLPHVIPFLSMNALNASKSYDGVIFSVARSPVLDTTFFRTKHVTIPSYAVSLQKQLSWFKTYLTSVCSTTQDCANRLRKSLILMGDIEGNDIGYPLAQGKSIAKVKSYVPFVIRAIIKATTELINMGATLIIIPGNSPIGCYPYILTALRTNDPTAYDDLGCLKNVNDLILSKNNDLQNAIKGLNRRFPNVNIIFGNFYNGVIDILREASTDSERSMALKACCGIGGKYNYNSERFCGSPGVPVCHNPEKYIFWDGLHFTQEAYDRIEYDLIQPALKTLNCTRRITSNFM